MWRSDIKNDEGIESSDIKYNVNGRGPDIAMNMLSYRASIQFHPIQ